jgi:phage-related protein
MKEIILYKTVSGKCPVDETQKTPSNEIVIAEKRKKEYFERKENG